MNVHCNAGGSPSRNTCHCYVLVCMCHMSYVTSHVLMPASLSIDLRVT